LAGLALGMGATGFSLWALWGVVQLLGRSAEVGTPPARGSSLVVLAFLVKLPLFVALGMLAHRLGGAAPACFLAGLGLVYFALVAWALAKS
jgi:nitrate/nitrite transporter NarK